MVNCSLREPGYLFKANKTAIDWPIVTHTGLCALLSRNAEVKFHISLKGKGTVSRPHVMGMFGWGARAGGTIWQRRDACCAHNPNA